MDYLKEGIGRRAMAQRDPLIEYQREGFDMFSAMLEGIKEETVGHLFNVRVQAAAPATPPEGAGADGAPPPPRGGGAAAAPRRPRPAPAAAQQAPKKAPQQAPQRPVPASARRAPQQP